MYRQYRISELAKKAGVTRRTVHYYISKGLIPPAIGSGVNSHYDDDHLARIILIKRLQEKYLPLDKIREVVAGLSYEEVQQMLDAVEKLHEEKDEKTLEIVADAVWDDELPGQVEGTEYVRIHLGMGIELNYPKALGQERPGLIKSLRSYAQKLMGEEN